MKPTESPVPLRASPWDRALRALAQSAGIQAAVAHATQPTLCLGAGYSDLLQSCLAASGTSPLLIADTDNRRLRRTRQAAGDRVQALRLFAFGDLRRDAASVEAAFVGGPVRDLDGLLAFEENLRHRLREHPAVADDSLDVLAMDFVLNRVSGHDRLAALGEGLRTLRRGGRVFAAVLLADEPLPGAHTIKHAPSDVPLHIPTEREALLAFEQAGFHGIRLHWPAVEDPAALDRIGQVDIRMCLIEAFKGKQGPCFELGQAVVYNGPWREVHDDDGHVYRRGERVAVCAKTYDLLMREPYTGCFTGLRAVNEPPLSDAALFDCNTPALRDPRTTKGLSPFTGERVDGGACGPGSGCC